jgi:hypothetical protein
MQFPLSGLLGTLTRWRVRPAGHTVQKPGLRPGLFCAYQRNVPSAHRLKDRSSVSLAD